MHISVPPARCIPVFLPNEVTPAFRATDAEASSWVEQGLAISWVRRGKTSIRLKFKAIAVIARGDSCKMGERVMIGNADGIPYFHSLLVGWGMTRMRASTKPMQERGTYEMPIDCQPEELLAEVTTTYA